MTTGSEVSISRSTGSQATTIVGAVMWDTDTHGGFDGLTATGPNLNQGAESTLALIATLQHAPRPLSEPVGAGGFSGPNWSTG